ncbi:MAG: tripartite tricarboxylate transporter TctB family protein [Pararhodobacter sp.]
MSDHRDILGGALLMAGGSFIALYAWHTLALGTIRRMGPGMFPFWIGVLMVLIGAAILAGGFLRSGRIPPVAWRSTATVLGAFACFALLVTPFGLLPAIVGLVVVSSLGDPSLRPLTTGLLCLVLPLLAWVIFRLGLDLPLTMLRWPF